MASPITMRRAISRRRERGNVMSAMAWLIIYLKVATVASAGAAAWMLENAARNPEVRP